MTELLEQGQKNDFELRTAQAIMELATSMSLIDNMQKENYLRVIFDTDELPIKHYPDSRFYACVIPVKVRNGARFIVPNRVTGKTREVVIDKLFEALTMGVSRAKSKEKSGEKSREKSGEKSRGNVITLTTLFDEFIENRKNDPDLTAHTVRKNQCDWNTFYKDTKFALTEISRLKPSDIMTRFKEMTAGRKMTRHAFGNAKGLLNQLFDLAFEKDLIERNICREISTRTLKFRPEGSRQELIYTNEERNRIVEELKGSDSVYDKAIIIQFCLGCRISEVKGLYWSDLDFDRKEIDIHRELVDDEDGRPILKNHTKSGLGEGNRILPMTPRAEAVFRSIPRPENKESFVFLRDYKPIKTQTVNSHLQAVCRKLNIRYLSSHKIRAWGITEALASGMDQASVMRIAGHATPETMSHYVRVARINKDIGDRFGSVFD